MLLMVGRFMFNYVTPRESISIFVQLKFCKSFLKLARTMIFISLMNRRQFRIAFTQTESNTL